jgi:hypothetical protein
MKRYQFWLVPFVAFVCWFPETCPGQLIVPSGPVKTSPPANSNSADQTKRPAWPEIDKSVKATLAMVKDYKPGDLITREDAAGVFAVLKKTGWEVKKSADLSERMLSSSDEMVRELRSKQGRKLMQNIGSVPGGYDRLDRLRSQPYGSRRLREVIQQPEGYKLIEYMATTPGGKQMGRELSSKTRGDFNAPTKKIYTEQQFLAELKTIYQSETETPPKSAAGR